MTFGVLVGSKNFCKLFCVSCEVVVLHGYACIQCVAHSVSMIVRHYCTSASSARSPCNLGSQADIAIPVHREVLFLAALKVIHEKNWKRFGVLEHFHLPDCPSSHSGKSCDKFPCTSSLSSFVFGISVSGGPCDRFPCTSSLRLSLLVDAGCSVWESRLPARKMLGM